ncbi:MAG TPA: hypothetical protein VNA28_03795 [Solirubrobacteraceae bacterium]|nr:hypothetical protein [Solirubrobacteraceae bacterium]
MRWIVAVALSASCVSLAACGKDSPAPVARQQTFESALRLVTERDIRATPPGSPQRAVIRWWRALQFRDTTTVSELFSTQARRTIGPLLSEITFLDLGPSLQTSLPRFDDLAVRGNTALVYMRILRNEVLSPKIIRRSTEHLGLSLVKERGFWRIDDPTYFLQAGGLIRRARLAAERRAAAQ